MDSSGRVVAVLADRILNPGIYRMAWDGKDGKGNDISGGTYLCELVTSSNRSIQKMMYLK